MFNRKNKIEVIETDVAGEKIYATKRTVIAALIPLAVTVPIMIHSLTKETYSSTTIPVSTQPILATIPPPVQIPSMPVSTTLQQMPPVIAEPAGVIADTSLEMLANVLDPLVNLMVAISFPIASVIIIGGCFFFMFNNSEKAWDTIGKAALGYVLIRLAPMCLDILRTVGDSVA